MRGEGSRAYTRRILLGMVAVLLLVPAVGLGVERFPRPAFETSYQMPLTTTPAPRAIGMEQGDVLVLLLALCAASYLVLKARSRRGIVLLSLFCVGYFGFFRKGCVCSVGSFQNVVLALADSSYAIPTTVLLVFLLPLFFTLFFGRTFCAAVCPLGALQDMAVVKPVKLPAWLAGALSLIPVIYLALAVLFAATGAGFIVCRYDPFVGFFRLHGPATMILTGLVFLVIGTVVARPYCRFLCPYGVLLGWLSRVSGRHATITPTDCISCRLCEEACPFDAILKPTPDKAPETRAEGRKRLGMLIMVAPVIMLIGGLVGYGLYVPLSRSVPTVATAEQVVKEHLAGLKPQTLDSEAFRGTGQPLADFVEVAREVQSEFKVGGVLLGVFIGLLLNIKLIGLALRRHRSTYEIDRDACLSCARCFRYCPKDREWRKDGDPVTQT